MDPADTVAVTALKDNRPTTVGELRKTLGLLSYYRPTLRTSRGLLATCMACLKMTIKRYKQQLKGGEGLTSRVMWLHQVS